MANKLSTKAVNECQQEDTKRNKEIGSLLKIEGKPVTSNEGLQLNMAAARKEFETWQRKKLEMNWSKFDEIYLKSQHEATGRMKQNSHSFAFWFVYHWLPSGQRMKIKNQLKGDTSPLCGRCNNKPSHFLRCKH